VRKTVRQAFAVRSRHEVVDLRVVEIVALIIVVFV